MEAVLVMIAGSLGALSRWGVGKTVRNALPDSGSFTGVLTNPVGTLIVNVLGCFLLGMAMEAVFVSDAIPKPYKIAITTGFLGAFTTFSTFGYETLDFIRNGEWLPAALNITANLTLGLLAVFLGVTLGKVLVS